MTAHPWLESAAVYALDALPADERAVFEAHLAQCEVCRNEVRAYLEVTGLLAHGVGAAEPPATLRDRVLRQAQRGGTSRSAARPAGGSYRWLAAAALVAAAGAGAYAWTVRAERAALAHQLAAARSALASRDSLLDALLAPDVATAQLTATDAAPSIQLYWNRRTGQLVMAAFRLPPAPGGRTYQLWAIPEGEAPVSVGVFNTSAEGQATVTFLLAPGAEYALSAVTEEPEGGSAQPTSQPFLVGSWSVPGA